MARLRWKLILAAVVAAIGVAAVLTFSATPVYSSSARLFVSTAQVDSGAAYQGSLFSAQRITSYADLVTSHEVARAVVAEQNLGMTPPQLAEKITATVLPDTVILEISVKDPDPQQAQALAQTVAQKVTDLVSELETPAGTDRAPIKATVVDPATVPTVPVSPQPLRNLVLATVLGLLLGFAAAVVRELLDVTVKEAQDVTAVAAVPVMASIPFDAAVAKDTFVPALESRNRRLEAFRVLRTNMQFVDVDKTSRVFTVTSSVPGEGKTSTVTNLAIMLAQAGQDVLLLEGDLRRPHLHRYLRVEQAVGLTTVLVGKMRMSEAVQASEVQHLSVLTSGTLPPNPSELLQSHAMADVIAEARATYDVVVIDAPPVLPVTDAALLTVQSDGALIVIRHGKTTREQLHHAVERLKAVGGRPLGAVLNMVPPGQGAGDYLSYSDEYPVAQVSSSSQRPVGREDALPEGKGRAESASVRVAPRLPLPRRANPGPEEGTEGDDRPGRNRGQARVRRSRPAKPSPDQHNGPTQPALVGTPSVSVVKAHHWDAVVRRLGGDAVYHSLGYHRASAALEPDGTLPVLLLHRGSLGETALPMLLRPLPSGRGRDATTPYGYGGPLSTSPVEDPDFSTAVDEWAAENQLLASFIRYHPLLANHVYGPRVADVSQLGTTVPWCLDSEADLLQGMHPHHRRAARKAERAGMEVRVTRAPRDLSLFREHYESTMRRQNAEQFYYFPDAYWQRLTRECQRHLLLVEGLVRDELVASILCMTGPPYLHYHLGSSTYEGRRIGASNRLFLEAATWARSNGLSKFHLGGGLGGSTDSSLYTFKQRFDPESEPQPFYVAKWVHDPTMYTVLAGSRSTDGYFPPWRR